MRRTGPPLPRVAEPRGRRPGHPARRRPPGLGAWQRRTLTGNGTGLRAVAVTPDGSRLATGDADGTVRIWSTATWTAGPDLAGHRGAVPLRSCARSPEGTDLAAAGLGGLYLFPLHT
ncbi:hypothetical protein ABZ924_26675 [Streptomyces sp. NPDC046876]|uniref:WD40 repeat domain-containing protein n=1 Tax=Streptomyces sp. NPDC046876 TaxID=3155616 RepID=UPI0033E6214C